MDDNKLLRQVANVQFDDFLDSEPAVSSGPAGMVPAGSTGALSSTKRPDLSGARVKKAKIYISGEAFLHLRRRQEEYLAETGRFISIGRLAEEAILKG